MELLNVRAEGVEGNLVFKEDVAGNGAQIHFGIDGDGLDVKFFGDTSGAYMLWDESADALVFAGLAKIDIGSSGTPLVLTAGTPIFEMYSTCASTSGSTSAESFLVKNTMTGVGGVGGRAKFHMYTDVALAGWSNALKAYAEYGTSGKTTGLGSALCAEMLLSAGTTSGNYAPLEAEIVTDSAVSTGTATAFLYCNLAGSNSTGKTTVNTNGYFCIIDTGIVDTTNGMLDAITSDATPVFEYRLRIKAAGVDMYIPVSTSATFAG